MNIAAIELEAKGLAFARQIIQPITYQGHDIADAYRLDFLVEELVVI